MTDAKTFTCCLYYTHELNYLHLIHSYLNVGVNLGLSVQLAGLVLGFYHHKIPSSFCKFCGLQFIASTRHVFSVSVHYQHDQQANSIVNTCFNTGAMPIYNFYGLGQILYGCIDFLICIRDF